MQLQQSKQMDIPKFTCAPALAFSFISFLGRVFLEKIHTTELAVFRQSFQIPFYLYSNVGWLDGDPKILAAGLQNQRSTPHGINCMEVPRGLLSGLGLIIAAFILKQTLTGSGTTGMVQARVDQKLVNVYITFYEFFDVRFYKYLRR